MKIKVLFGFLCLLTAQVMAQNLSLSFDDGLNPQRQPLAPQWNQQILEDLARYDIKAIFYVTGGNVNTPAGLTLVKHWSEHGHALANHTYNHFSLHSNEVSLNQYLSDIARNEQLLKDFNGWTKRFRFPYLKEGNSVLKRDGVRAWLDKKNYASGAVSIDASDWYYNKHYLKLLKNNQTDKLALLKQAYLDHLFNRALYYDSLSKQVLDRSIDHVLLLHVNAINGAFLSDVIKHFSCKGWTFIDPLKAYNDPAYQLNPDVLPAGESLMWQLAKQKGIENLRYPAENSRYERAKIDKLLKNGD